MSKFTYTLPSGSTYVLNAPEGTTQTAADKMFYSQVAAGTFAGYKPGDTLSSPSTILTNFGLSRLQRGTAGVDDQTLLAIVSKLPIVAPVPNLATTAVQNPINQADFAQVLSNPTGLVNGLIDSQPLGIGVLNSTQVQALMAQIASTVNQSSCDITQEKGVGKYGFNSIQLERAGYIKPGYSSRYCPINENTQQNPNNFIEFMKSPAPWSGVNGVVTVDNILCDDALQNQIQHKLMLQSYNGFVDTGTITPATPAVTTPSVSTGQVYTNNGILTSVTPLTLLTSSGIGINSANNNLLQAVAGNILSGINTLTGLNGNISSLPADPPVGTISGSLSNLGSDAVSIYNNGITSLSSGAVGFNPNTTNLHGGLTQISGLAAIPALNNAAVSITTSLRGDVGALIANGSKFGVGTTNLWAANTNQLTPAGIDHLTVNLQSSASRLGSNLTTALNSLGVSSQFSVVFADLSCGGLSSGSSAAGGFSNTVNRSTLDAAYIRVIGSSKITPPSYDLPSVSSLGKSADIAQAQSLLNGLQKTAAGLLTSTGVPANIANQTVKIAGKLFG